LLREFAVVCGIPGIAQLGIQLMAARVFRPRRAAPRCTALRPQCIGLAVGARLKGGVRELTCFGSWRRRMPRTSQRYPAQLSVRSRVAAYENDPESRLLPPNSTVFSGRKLPDGSRASRDPGIPRMLNVLRVCPGIGRMREFTISYARSREMLDSIYCSQTSRNCGRCSGVELIRHSCDYAFSE